MFLVAGLHSQLPSEFGGVSLRGRVALGQPKEGALGCSWPLSSKLIFASNVSRGNMARSIQEAHGSFPSAVSDVSCGERVIFPWSSLNLRPPQATLKHKAISTPNRSAGECAIPIPIASLRGGPAWHASEPGSQVLVRLPEPPDMSSFLFGGVFPLIQVSYKSKVPLFHYSNGPG